MTAIAAWMIVCIFFVWGALIGYAWLLWKKKKSCLKRHRHKKIGEEEGKIRAKRKEEQRCKTDDIFFVVFPMMFLLFNLIYWPMCLKGQEESTTGDWQQPRVIPEDGYIPGLAPTVSPPGLPLGIYTSHWKKSVPHKKLGGCHSSLREDRCSSASYVPSDMDYDFQGIFSTDVW